ncbi:MAG: protein-L-isoaspartate O-methyltransferase [Methanobacteriota archaeon]|nr:MAG: protein-L-isoaspartate O-methyltransferase [Euryarchaeota archaeon]
MGFPYVKEAEYKCRESGFMVPHSVIDAMNKIDRTLFVPQRERARAKNDWAIPILDGQTTSAPHMVMMMLSAAEIKEGDIVLEIGTGSGYNTALLSLLVGSKGKVYSIERKELLIEFAKRNLSKVNLPSNYEILHGDGTKGIEGQEFDKILVTAAGPFIPSPLCWQLKIGGIMIIPVQRGSFQYLLKVSRLPEGKQEECIYCNPEDEYPPLAVKELTGVRFVRLIGDYGFKD